MKRGISEPERSILVLRHGLGTVSFKPVVIYVLVVLGDQANTIDLETSKRLVQVVEVGGAKWQGSVQIGMTKI